MNVRDFKKELEMLTNFQQCCEMQIAGLREKIKEQEEREQQKKKTTPSEGEKFYYIDERGGVCSGSYCDQVDFCMILIGNCFKTKEEARDHIARLILLEELKEFACDIKEFKLYDDKWYLSYNSLDKKISIDRDGIFARHDIYFKSKEDAEKALEIIGEKRIKKYYLGIKENGYDK